MISTWLFFNLFEDLLDSAYGCSIAVLLHLFECLLSDYLRNEILENCRLSSPDSSFFASLLKPSNYTLTTNHQLFNRRLPFQEY